MTKRNSKGRPAGSGCCSIARQEKNALKGLMAERDRMTRNDPLVLRSAKQAPSAPSQGLEFGPSPKQQAQDKTKVKLKEEIIQTTENPCEKGATTNNTEQIPATTTTKQESPCEKGASTTTKEECPCEKGATSNNTEQIPATTTKQESPCEKGAATTTTSSRQDSSFEKGAQSEVDYGVSSSSTSSSSSSQNPAPKKEAKSVAEPLEKKETKVQPKSLDKRPMPQQKQSTWQQSGHQVWRKKSEAAVPCEKGTAVPCEKGLWPPRPAVAVDWYNTLYTRDHVPQENLDSPWRFYDEGYQVYLLSFCGYNRSLEVKQKAWGLAFPFESINFTRGKSGVNGKGQWLLDNKIDILFDDSEEVRDDCLRKGIWVYHIAKHQCFLLGS